MDKLIRPGWNDADPPRRQHRSIEGGNVHFNAFEEYSGYLREQLAYLAIHTPNNSRVARRLLQRYVFNRIEGDSTDADIAEVLRADVQKANRHMQRYHRDYPQGFTTKAQKYWVTQNGVAATLLLKPFGNVHEDRDELTATKLENLLLYQHILADEDSVEARNTQLNWNYI